MVRPIKNTFNIDIDVKKIQEFSGVVDTAFTESKVTTTGNKVIDLATSFTIGLSSPEINKGSGEILYLDNRPLIARNSRQKEDIKIILEF